MKIKTFPLSLFLLSLLFGLGAPLSAQIDFAPVGAQWWYANHYISPWPNTIYSVESTRDTVVAGRDCRLLEYTFYGRDSTWVMPEASVLVSSDDDRVYLYLRDSFHVLYDFTATVGSILRIPVAPALQHYGYGNAFVVGDFDTYFDVEVDSVFTVDFSGQRLRAYHTKPFRRDDGIEVMHWYYGDAIVEKVGPIGDNAFFGIFGIKALGGSVCPAFQCYSDSSLAYQEVSPCDRMFPHTATRELPLADWSLDIHPNPTQDLLWINGPDQMGATLRIFGATGQVVYAREGWRNEGPLSTRDWAPGWYWLYYEYEGRHRTEKFLVVD